MAFPASRQQTAYLTNDEAAERLRVSPRTLERMRIDGTGPRFFKAGPGKRSRVLYREEDLEAWLNQFSYQAVSEYGQGGEA